MAHDSKQAAGYSLSRSGCSAVLSGNKKSGKSSYSKSKRPNGPALEKRFELAFDPCSMIVAFSRFAGSESRRESEPEGLNSTATQRRSVLLVCGIVSSVQQLESMERDFFHIPPNFDGNVVQLSGFGLGLLPYRFSSRVL